MAKGSSARRLDCRIVQQFAINPLSDPLRRFEKIRENPVLLLPGFARLLSIKLSPCRDDLSWRIVHRVCAKNLCLRLYKLQEHINEGMRASTSAWRCPGNSDTYHCGS